LIAEKKNKESSALQKETISKKLLRNFTARFDISKQAINLLLEESYSQYTKVRTATEMILKLEMWSFLFHINITYFLEDVSLLDLFLVRVFHIEEVTGWNCLCMQAWSTASLRQVICPKGDNNLVASADPDGALRRSCLPKLSSSPFTANTSLFPAVCNALAASCKRYNPPLPIHS